MRNNMETGIVTTKGQIVIPSKLRNRHGIKKGTRVCFIEQGTDIVLRPVTDEYIDSLRGLIPKSLRILEALAEEKRAEREL